MKNETEPGLQICAATDSNMEQNQIWQIHSHSGHPTLSGKIATSVMKEDLKSAIRSCLECLSIDLAPVLWEKGK